MTIWLFKICAYSCKGLLHRIHKPLINLIINIKKDFSVAKINSVIKVIFLTINIELFSNITKYRKIYIK